MSDGNGTLTLIVNGNATGMQVLSGDNSSSNTGYSGGTTITSGILPSTTHATGPGRGNLSLGGGELQLANASGSGLTFNRPTSVTASAKITSDVTAANTAGDTFALGRGHRHLDADHRRRRQRQQRYRGHYL